MTAAMLKISGDGRGTFGDDWIKNSETKEILSTMRNSRHVYAFESAERLSFELTVRQNIVGAARALNRSGAGFATFYNSRCNERFWNLTSKGGFRLKAGVESATALNDIFQNGSQYAFECATAMVIVLYKGVLDSIGAASFNRHFSNLFLWDWEYDDDLGLRWYVPFDYLSGDVRYFKNPDVDPNHIQWQGENAIDMGNGLYYGHGIGIVSAEEIVAALNRNRRPGADRSAYLMREAGRPAYRHLAQFAGRNEERSGDALRDHFVTVTVGDSLRVY